MSTRSKLDRLEKLARKHRADEEDMNVRHSVWIIDCQLHSYPGIELVEPQDTDPQTYQEIAYMRAVGRRDWAEAERLMPPPPKSPEGASLVEVNNMIVDGIDEYLDRMRRALQRAHERTGTPQVHGTGGTKR